MAAKDKRRMKIPVGSTRGVFGYYRQGAVDPLVT